MITTEQLWQVWKVCAKLILQAVQVSTQKHLSRQSHGTKKDVDCPLSYEPGGELRWSRAPGSH